MGLNINTPLTFLSIQSSKDLISTLKNINHAEETESIADVCEKILLRLKYLKWFKSKNTVMENGGLGLFLELLRIWESNEIVILLVLKNVWYLLTEEGAPERIIRAGGKETVERLIEIHKDDKEIRYEGGIIIGYLVNYGSMVAMRQVRKVRKAIQYGIPLNAVSVIRVEHTKKAKISPFEYVTNTTGLEENQIIDEDDGMTSFLKSMSTQKCDEHIQEAGVEVILLMSKKIKDGIIPGDSRKGITAALVDAMSNHPNSERIHWRGCNAVANLCNDSQICLDLGKGGACEVVMTAYDRFFGNHSMMQQTLWAIVGLCEADYCVLQLEKLGLKLLIYKLILSEEYTANGTISVPFKLKYLYELKDLKDSANIQSSSKIEDENVIFIGTSKVKMKPTHGTVKELFHIGELGLV